MVAYNSRSTYNSRVNYNSASYHIIVISDRGNGSDSVAPLFLNILVKDSALGTDFIDLTNILSEIIDNGVLSDAIDLTNTLSEIKDNGLSYETISLLVLTSLIQDSATGTDSVEHTEYPASQYLVVTTDQFLQPLGAYVLADSRLELLPSTKENTEEIPGVHGEIDFGSQFKPRLIELKVATKDKLTPAQKAELRRKFAQYLNPLLGPKKLIFLDDPSVVYNVKYSGKIDPTNHPEWFEFVIPLKMSNPFIESATEKTLVGSGVITNEGTAETGLIIEIAGPATDPSFAIGNYSIEYHGTIPADQKLIIDTEKQTVKLGFTNVLSDYNGHFPILSPGESLNVEANENVTIRWKDKWV